MAVHADTKVGRVLVLGRCCAPRQRLRRISLSLSATPATLAARLTADLSQRRLSAPDERDRLRTAHSRNRRLQNDRFRVNVAFTGYLKKTVWGTPEFSLTSKSSFLRLFLLSSR